MVDPKNKIGIGLFKEYNKMFRILIFCKDKVYITCFNLNNLSRDKFFKNKLTFRYWMVDPFNIEHNLHFNWFIGLEYKKGNIVN